MKKTMSVSVDENVIKLAKEVAYEARVSFSSFVEGAIRLRVDAEMPIDPLVRKESKVESDTQIIANGQAKLDAIRKDRNIKQDKIAKVREKVESITGFSGGYSKDDQTRKKGK